MFNEVLKFGSYIVDALRTYKQPVLVYIPPGGEIRGGAWVVLDTLINPDFIEMYASTTSRGGVLEPNATAGLKFRGKNLINLMNRTDPTLLELQEKPPSQLGLKHAMKERQELLRGLYRQVTVEFADLHDRPERMLAKKVIRDIVSWKNSRRYFYWRLRRRLHVQTLYKQMDDETCMPEVQEKFNEMIFEKLGEKSQNDEIVARWCDDNTEAMKTLASDLQQSIVLQKMKSLMGQYPGKIDSLLKALKKSKKETTL